MNTLAEYGYAQDGKVYLNAYMDFPGREIGVVKESEEQSLNYFIKRFDLAKNKVTELQNAVLGTPNKGSYLMKLIHMRTYLAEFDGLGDFPSLFAVLDELEADIRVYVQENRGKNYEIKKALLDEALSLKESQNWNIATKKFKDVKLRWIKTGSAHTEFEKDFNEQFDAAFAFFFESKSKFFEDRRKMVEQRLMRYEQAIDQLHKVIREMPEDAFQQVKRLEKNWKVIGKVPVKNFKDLQKKFRDELNKYYNTLKRSRPQAPVTYKNPADRKRELVEKVEQMLDLPEAPLDEVKSIQNEWKHLGKLKHPSDKDFNTRFKIACNEIFESHFLTKTARSKYEHFDEKTKFEQLKIKIRLLKESIKVDEAQLSQLNESDGSRYGQQGGGGNRYGGGGGYNQGGSGGYNQPGNTPGGYGQDRQPINMEKLNQINKLKTKQRILKKLQDQLLTNY
jgi:Domain of Unknown Function (DUF349)